MWQRSNSGGIHLLEIEFLGGMSGSPGENVENFMKFSTFFLHNLYSNVYFNSHWNYQIFMSNDQHILIFIKITRFTIMSQPILLGHYIQGVILCQDVFCTCCMYCALFFINVRYSLDQSKRNRASGPGPRVFDIEPFLGRGVTQWLFLDTFHKTGPWWEHI